MTQPTTIQLIATLLFALALIHTFSTKWFEHLAHTRPAHAGLWHLLAEVEIVFGVWAMLLMVCMGVLQGFGDAMHYLDGRNFTEPLFVFAIMVTAASKPVLQAASAAINAIARVIPLQRPLALAWTVLAIVPLLGSFITEPAAMTLAALLLRDTVFASSNRKLQYAALGVLFVNVSIGGTLTPYAAPPVLMVAKAWGLDMAYMIGHVGWKAAIAVLINSVVFVAVFAKDLRQGSADTQSPYRGVPAWLVVLHLLFLACIVVFAHHPAAFVAVFLLFMGVAAAYPQHQQDRLMLREALLVAFFLGGLVVLGGMQQWWLQPVLTSMSATSVYYGATALTAITDNAALTYLGSLVEGLSPEFRYALLTGAVTGGGLTIIANAPNPAGAAILRSRFDEGSISAVGLLLGAALPTVVAIACFRLLPL
ncbi:putative Na+/H+ antiporter [Curvibacter sp. CHRR-16]|uniref:putative Na+/H+ antiporter n=1 Tax=Curvibacter sp. CHRR-16 TaxID=2835872 RepID=UPI001BDA0D7B|nr:putative Na+/H+ antiporter [Curvibacter sp. CHRR-16]MBT0570784.1 putative Na+/H+ antiporter [Curvibacter sp. CHRR-16]